MIKNINIIQYRKLKKLTLNFTKKVNAISGTNGTCKTSLLHWINNPINKPEVDRFYNQLRTLFWKVAPYHEINPKDWS